MRGEALDAERRIVGEDAAKWLFELADGDSGQRAAFVAWLKESPSHVEEFLFASATLKEIRARSYLSSPEEEIERLIAEALRSPADVNVVVLREETAATEPEVRAREHCAPSQRHASSKFHTISGQLTSNRLRARWWITALAASLVAVIAGFLALPRLPFLKGHTYTTAVGEQRAVRLMDGSVVYLNTRSRIKVDYSTTARDLRLLAGEAIFKVEPDAARPFRVYTDNAMIQALGTQFNVYRRPEGTTVSVLEGKVRVLARHGAKEGDGADTASGGTVPHSAADDSIAPGTAESSSAPAAGGARPAVSVAAGEQARIAVDGAIEKPAQADVAQAIAWRERRLVFRAERLEEIAAEFSRYSPQRIRPLDDAARNQRITGTFDADDPESLVLFLQKLEELEVVREGREFLVRGRL